MILTLLSGYKWVGGYYNYEHFRCQHRSLVFKFHEGEICVTFNNLDTNYKNWGRKILLHKSHITTNQFFKRFMVKRTFYHIQLRDELPKKTNSRISSSNHKTAGHRTENACLGAMLSNLSLSPPLYPEGHSPTSWGWLQNECVRVHALLGTGSGTQKHPKL